MGHALSLCASFVCLFPTITILQVGRLKEDDDDYQNKKIEFCLSGCRGVCSVRLEDFKVFMCKQI